MTVSGIQINEIMQNEEVLMVHAIKGIIDGVNYHIWCLKEPYYVMKMMVMAEGLFVMECEKDNIHKLYDGSQVVFKH